MPNKKEHERKGHGLNTEPTSLLESTRRMDLHAIRACVERNTQSIHELDSIGNNAMHLCIAGGATRVGDIIDFFLMHTEIDLLHENDDGQSPLELAFSMNDQFAIERLERPTLAQLNARYPDPPPSIQPV